MSDKKLDRSQKESLDMAREGRPLVMDYFADVQERDIANPEDLHILDEDNGRNDRLDLDEVNIYEDSNSVKNESTDIKLILNQNALEKVTFGPEDPNRIAIENIVSFWSQTPEQIEAVGFESNGHAFTNFIVKTKGGSEISVPLFIMRTAIEGVSKAVNTKTNEVSGISLTAKNGSKTDIYPQLTKKQDGMSEIRKAVKSIKIGENKLLYDTEVFVRDEQKSIPVSFSQRQEVSA